MSASAGGREQAAGPLISAHEADRFSGQPASADGRYRDMDRSVPGPGEGDNARGTPQPVGTAVLIPPDTRGTVRCLWFVSGLTCRSAGHYESPTVAYGASVARRLLVDAGRPGGVRISSAKTRRTQWTVVDTTAAVRPAATTDCMRHSSYRDTIHTTLSFCFVGCEECSKICFETFVSV